MLQKSSIKKNSYSFHKSMKQHNCFTHWYKSGMFLDYWFWKISFASEQTIAFCKLNVQYIHIKQHILFLNINFSLYENYILLYQQYKVKYMNI